MNNTFYDPHTYFLAHHGIVGQKWGKRNGPPYPLNASTHNRVVKRGKKVGSKSSRLFEYDKKTRPDVYKERDSEREKYKKNRSGPLDDKTGLRLKTSYCSMKEDAKLVNPGFEEGAYGAIDSSYNCMFCSATYESRRRGFDTIAKLSPKPISLLNFYKLFPKAKVLSIENYDVTDKNSLGINIPTRLIKKIKSSSGDGDSRGIITVYWDPIITGSSSAHAMNYSVNNNKLHLIDSQSGDVYDEEESYGLLTNISSAMFFRTDNTEFNDSEMKKYME